MNDKRSYCHSVLRSYCHSVLRSYCHSVSRSYCHSVSRSYCHSVLRCGSFNSQDCLTEIGQGIYMDFSKP